jgi:hypothetical protein
VFKTVYFERQIPMNNKPILLVMMITAFVLGACGFNINVDMNEGSGNIISETRQVSDFDWVQLNGLGDVILSQGDREQLTIEAEDNVITRITTEVRDGVLYIGFDRKVVLPTKTIKYYLTMRDIRGLETKGVSNIQAEKIDTDRLDVSISGTGNINIFDLSAQQLFVNISGAGNFQAEGEISEQKVNLSGAGSYDSEDLSCKNADITITGLGKVTLWVSDNLDVTISGAGGVDYYGNPQVNQQISGLGNLKRLGSK